MRAATEARPSKLVVVVDDDRDTADSLAMVLEARGYAVRTAYNGRDAVALTKQLVPSVVVSDLDMPGMSGIEAARTVRSMELPRQPCMVAVTGGDGPALQIAAITAGFDRFLVKPANLSLLFEIIEKC
jgi:CheY-like chemotaxis protein